MSQQSNFSKKDNFFSKGEIEGHSDDKNKIPLRVKADLAVGSLRADLEAFKGLKYPFKIIVEN